MQIENQNENKMEKNKTSSLHQTKARYLQVIQDLTKDHQSGFQQTKETNSISKSKSYNKRVSKSCSSIDLYNGNNSSAMEETPEEIRQYVKQFKQEVEEKFSKSESNRNYVFPKFGIYDNNMNGKIHNDVSIESLEIISRYDLNSQKIKKKYLIPKSQSGNS